MGKDKGGDSGGEKKKTKSVSISTYARVRCFFSDRESLRRAVVAKSKREAGGKKGTLTTLASEEESVRSMTTQFTDVIGEKGSNEDAYNVICVPLIEKVLEGFKAILIAYGQTGSGKTFSLIGAKGPGQLGLLPRTCKTLLDSDQVIKLQLKAFEAYSTTLTKITLFDLFEECNKFTFEPFVPKSSDKMQNKADEYKWVQRKSQAAQALWNTKSGRTGVNAMTEGSVRDMPTVEDAFHLIEEAHDASHFAKTGKNPESSRGHTVYVVLVQMKNPKGADYSAIRTEFVVVDLAGSEGGSTLEKLPDGMEKTVRFLEGGVINYGLTSLKDMFSEMRKKGKLKQSQGNGLRKLLYPFMTTNTMMSIIFTLSPSWDNVMPTRATMKFAQDACKLKMKPVADTGSKNWKALYDKLKETLSKKDEVIEKMQAQIAEGIEHHEAAAASGAGQMEELLGHIYQEQQDKVEGLFKDYELFQFIDSAIKEDVENDIEETKGTIGELLKKVFRNEAPERIEEIDDMMDDWISRGIGLRTGYEFMCEMYDVVPEKLMARKATRGLSINKAAHDEHRRKQAMWIESANALHTEVNAHLSNDELAAMEELAESGDLEFETDVPGADPTFKHMATDRHANIIFEDIDLSQAPDFWDRFDDDQQAEIEAMFEDERNVEKGKLKYKFVKKATKELKITRHQLNELKDYLMVKKGEKHAHQLVSDFRAEVGDDVEAEDLSLVVDLKQQIHQLENEKRVEKSLKLWGQMRLRIRDRKLKETEAEMDILKKENTEKNMKIDMMQKEMDTVRSHDHELLEKMSRTISDGGMASPKIESQLNSLMTLVTVGGGAGAGGLPDEKLEDDLREAKMTIARYEESLEQYKKIEDAIKNEQMQVLVRDLGAIQQKYTGEKVKNQRMEGRILEIRKVLRDQARKIETLTQQIFIILQFPKVITVTGREGFNDKINGNYHVGEYLHCGRVFYKHQENLWALRWHPPKGLWIFDHRGVQHDDVGSACVECDVNHPLLVNKQWIVFGGEKEGFVVDPNVRITGSLEMPADAEQKRNPGKTSILKKVRF